MKTLYIEQPKQQKYLYLFLASTFVLQGVLNLAKNEPGFTFWFGIFQLVFAISLVLYAFSIIRPNAANAPRIHLGNEDITLHKGLIFHKPKTIQHTDIKVIQLKPEELNIITNSYDFQHSMHYEGINKKELMEEIQNYANANSIAIERINYNG